jgi:RNA-directed DNA polymerase
MDGQRPDNRARVEREAPTFDAEAAGEAREDRAQEAEPSTALFDDEPPATFTTVTMEAICEPANLARAFMRVQANRGAAGVDGMAVDDLPDWLREHWPRVLRELAGGAYRPAPVRRVEIPKPDGGKRRLGIPTVLDRLIQQAMLQVMSPA